MKASSLDRLQRLGFQFWSPKLLKKEILIDEEEKVFLILAKKILIAGDLKEFDNYPRFIPSICRILGISDLDIEKISKKEALENDFHLIIDFVQDLSFKSKKTLKFDSLKLLMNEEKFKKHLFSELNNLS